MIELHGLKWNRYRRVKAIFLVVLLLLSAGIAPAQSAVELNAQNTIGSLHQQVCTKPLPVVDRLNAISSAFLNKPYMLWPLGEGVNGDYDQFPLYRTDAFDCLTFVETVLAIALSRDLTSFTQSMNGIRYQKGIVSFVTRNHFTELDWNINNQRLGILKDITATIHDEHHHPVALIAQAKIDKAAWYQHIPLERVRLSSASKEEQKRRLHRLKQSRQNLPIEDASITYIPLDQLFNHKQEPNYYLFRQIPEGAIVEIVRPNWDLVDKIGTHLNVSHLGFVFLKNNELIFRNASSLKGGVVDQPLIAYLRDALNNSSTIKGINVQVVLDPGPKQYSKFPKQSYDYKVVGKIQRQY